MTRRFEYVSSLEAPHINLTSNDDFRLYSFAPQNGDGDEYTGRKDLFMGIGYHEKMKVNC